MRKYKQRPKTHKYDIAPWTSHEKLETERHHDLDQIRSNTISILNSKIRVSHSLDSRRANFTANSIKMHKIGKVNIHEKTLSYIKDYYNKYYTEEGDLLYQKKVPNQKERKNPEQNYNKSKSPLKKTSIVDLTRTLQDNINQSKKNICYKKNPKQYPGSNVLRIKQQMIRNKQRRKIDQRKILQIDELRPESRTMPVRVQERKSQPLKKSIFAQKYVTNTSTMHQTSK